MKADGTLRSVEGGVGGFLGGTGKALGSHATTAAGAAAAGLASIGGIIAAGASLTSGIKDFYDSGRYEKEGNTRAAEVSRGSGIMKGIGIGTGAMAGAAIGSVVPVIGTGVGAAVGAGIGGLAGWLGGNKAKETYEKEVTEKLKLEAVRIKEAAAELEKHTLEQRQAKFASEELRQALADTSVTAEEFSRMFERTVTTNIHNRFGEMKLDAMEISSMVTQIINTGDFDELTVLESAKAKAADAYQSMQSSLQGMDKLNWKIGLGMELDGTELESWRAGLEGVYNNAKSYVENAHWEASAAVKLLVNPESDVDFSGLDTAYAQINERLNSLGTEYNAQIKLALEDGVITLDEQAEIQNLQGQITAITDKVSSIEATADMKALQIKYSGATLDYDSFTALQQELDAQVAEMTASYDEALKVGIASLELQLSEGAIDQPQYDAQLQALAEGYHGKISNLAVEVEGFQLDTIVSAYETELNRVFPDLEGTTTERLKQALNAALAADIDVTGLTSEQVAGWLGLDESLAAETQEEIANLLQSVAETIPTNMAASIASGFENADISGVPVDGLVNPVLQEITDRLSAGAAEQDYSATGSAVTGGAADAIAGADRAPIYSAVEGVYNDAGTAVDSAFAQGFRTETTVRVHANYILENPSMDFRPSYQQGTINVSVAGHASGGFVKGAELSWIGEDGPEAIIPLGTKRRGRGLELYEQVGEILGVAKNANGGVYGRNIYNAGSDTHYGGSVYNAGSDTRYGGNVYNAGNDTRYGGSVDNAGNVANLSNQYVSGDTSASYSMRHNLSEIQSAVTGRQSSLMTVHNAPAASILNSTNSTLNSLAEIQNAVSNSQPSMQAVYNASSLSPSSFMSVFNTNDSQYQNDMSHAAAYQNETREAYNNAYSSHIDAGQNTAMEGMAAGTWQRAGASPGMSVVEPLLYAGGTAPTGFESADAPSWSAPSRSAPSWTFEESASPDFVYPDVADEAPSDPGWTAAASLLLPEDGGSGGIPSTDAGTVSNIEGGDTIEIHVEQHNEYNVDGKNLDEAKVVAIINAHALDNANELAREIAKQIRKALDNTPAKGRA